MQPENKNGFEDDDGCPDKVLDVSCERIDLGGEKIFFDLDKARIKPVSFAVLDKVVETLKSYPDIRLVRIEGHTDSQGSAEYNVDLSQRRVESVRDRLIERGIDGRRLVARGYGEERPIDTNRTKEGRANNRRVEVVILEREGCPPPGSAGAATP